MAATLAYLKSRELLPAMPVDEEETSEEDGGVDPREELIRRLIEYERFRDAGLDLANRPLTGRDVFPRGGDLSIQAPDATLAPVTLFRLAEAYNRVLDRAKIREDHEVVLEPITVRTRMHQLSLLLTEQPRIGFEDLFLQQVWSSERELRQMLVVTLMSVLEMVKLGVLGVYQAPGSDTISLERAVEVDRMHHVIDDFREEDEIAAVPSIEPAAPPPAELEPEIITSPPVPEPIEELEPEVQPDTPPPEPEREREAIIEPEPECEPNIEPEPPCEPEPPSSATTVLPEPGDSD
jgi:segregation and condensation protein A